MTKADQLRRALGRASFGFALLAIAACSSAGGAAWTYAPLGPTPNASAAASPGSSPAGQLLQVQTTDANPLAFDPAVLNAPPATLVTVNYTNNSSILHNINFFAGPDQNSPSLGASEKVTGPNALRSVTFTTPTAPGDYYFWCDVHLAAMSGHLHIAAN